MGKRRLGDGENPCVSMSPALRVFPYMRILFIGTGDIGIPALQSLAASSENLLIGVITQPDKPVGRHQELQASPIKNVAIRHGIAVFQPDRIREPSAIARIQDLKPDVIVVMAYGQILPRAVLDAPALACLNLHASLLPRHRGAAPVQAAIESGDRESGITVMHIAEGLDTGDIFLSKSIPIRRRETGGSLHDRLALLAPEALAEALALIGQGTIPRTPQVSSLSQPSLVPAERSVAGTLNSQLLPPPTYAAKLTRENGHIDWRAGAGVIDRKIRAMNPWPAAFTTFHGTGGHWLKLKIFTAIVCRKKSGLPGEVLCADRNGILVGAGEGALLLREIQIEGKKRMSARDFLLGHPIALGATLGES